MTGASSKCSYGSLNPASNTFKPWFNSFAGVSTFSLSALSLVDHISDMQACAIMGVYGPRTVFVVAFKDIPGTHEFLLQVRSNGASRGPRRLLPATLAENLTCGTSPPTSLPLLPANPACMHAG
jgi:hypothetical protein